MTTGKTIALTDHILCHSYHIWMSILIPKSQCLLLKLPKTHLNSHSRMSDAKSWLIWKDPDTGKDWRQEEKGTTEDEMVGWNHRLNGHEFEEIPGVSDGQGGLVCCSPWDQKELDTTERLHWTECSSYILPTSLWEDPYIVVEMVHILELARARFESHLFYITTVWLW